VSNDVAMAVNGEVRSHRVPDRTTLADFLRERCELTGTHLGCEQGVCGACTVLVDGRSVRSCLVLAGQADGAGVLTVEGLGSTDAGRELQQAFDRHDALQCGFCTPGMLITCVELLARAQLDDASARAALSGNLCRCTGYEGIVAAVLEVHARRGPTPLDASSWSAPQAAVTESAVTEPAGSENGERLAPARTRRPDAQRLAGLALLGTAVVAVVLAIWRARRRRPT
jgi:carbon-monoxide dehydrogenase small subunit